MEGLSFSQKDFVADLAAISKVKNFEPSFGVDVDKFLSGDFDNIFDEETQVEALSNAYASFVSSRNVFDHLHERALVELSNRFSKIINLYKTVSPLDGGSEKALLAQEEIRRQTTENVNLAKERHRPVEQQLAALAGDFACRLVPAGKEATFVLQEFETFSNTLNESITKRDYLDCFVSHMYDVSFSVPVDYIRQLSGSPSSSLNSAYATSMQMQKDVERDKFLINGILYKGSKNGYLGIWNAVQKAILSAHEQQHATPAQLADSHHRPSSPGAVATQAEERVSGLKPFEKLSHSEINGFVGNVLHAVNRTQSGGDTFDLLNTTFGSSGIVMLVPNSKTASPLKIDIDCGAFKEEDFRWSYGVRARVIAPLTFNICDINPETEEDAVWANVTGFFERLLVLPLCGPAEYDRGLTDTGSINIEMGMD